MDVENHQAVVTAERLIVFKQQAKVFERSQKFLGTVNSILDEMEVPEDEMADDLRELRLHYAACLTAAIEIFGLTVEQHEADVAISSYKFNKRVADLEARNQTLTDDHAALSARKNKQVADLEASIRAKTEENIALQADKAALINEVTEMKKKLVDEETKHSVAIQAIKVTHSKEDRKRRALTSQLGENTTAVQQAISEAQTAVLKADTDTADANIQTEDADNLIAELAKVKAELERLTAGAQTVSLKAEEYTADAKILTEGAASIKSRLAKLKAGVEKLTSEAQTVSLKAKISTADAEIQTDNVDSIEAEAIKLKANVKALTADTEAMRTAAEKVKTDTEVKVKILESEVKAAEARADTAEEEAKAAKEQAEEKISSLEADVKILTVETEAMRTAAGKVKVDAEAEAKILESEAKAANARAETAEDEAKAAKEQLEAKVNILESEAEAAQARAHTAEGEAKAAKEQLEAARANIEEAKAEANAAKSSVTTSDTQLSRADQEAARGELRTAKAETTTAQKAAEIGEAETVAAREAVKIAEAETAAVKKAAETAEAEILTVREAVKIAEAETVAARGAAKAAEAEAKSMKEMLDEAKKGLAAVVAEHKECGEARRDSSLKLDQANKELRDAQQTISHKTSNFVSLREIADKAVAETLAARGAVETAEADSKSSKRVLDEVKKDLAAVTAEHKECRQVRRDSSLKLGQANKGVREAQQRLSDTSSKFASLQREAEELRKLMSQSQGNEIRLQQLLDSTTGELEQQRQATASFQETRNDLGSRLENTEPQGRMRASNTYAEATAEIDRLKAEDAGLRAQVDTEANAAQEEIDEGGMDVAKTKGVGNDAAEAIHAKHTSDDGLDKAIDGAVAEDRNAQSSIQTTTVIPSGASSAFTFTHPNPAASSTTAASSMSTASAVLPIFASTNTAVTHPKSSPSAADTVGTGNPDVAGSPTLPPTTTQGHRAPTPQSLQQSQENPAPVDSGNEVDDPDEPDFRGVLDVERDPYNGVFQYEGMEIPIGSSIQRTPPSIQPFAPSHRNRRPANAAPRPTAIPGGRFQRDEQGGPAVPEAETATQQTAMIMTNTGLEPNIQPGSHTASTGRSQGHLQRGALADWTARFNTEGTSEAAESTPVVRPAQFEVPRIPTRSDGTRAVLNPKSKKGPGGVSARSDMFLRESTDKSPVAR